MEMTMLELDRATARAVFSQEVWTHIAEAIHGETKRTKVLAQVLEAVGPLPDSLTVPSDITVFDDVNDRLTVDEGATTAFTESLVQLALTPKQVENEEELKTAVTLSVRAANLLSQAQDLLILRGEDSTKFEPLKSGRVLLQNGPPGVGLAEARPDADRVIEIDPVNAPGEPKRYGENTFEAVADAYTRLYSFGFPPPLAAVFPPFPYADAWAGPPTTLMATADRIQPLVTAGFYPSGALPVTDQNDPTSPSTGLVFAPKGNTMDLAVGVAATMVFEQKDNRGFFLFRIYERFAFRLKEKRSVIQLKFK